jgi:hypothetical protein
LPGNSNRPAAVQRKAPVAVEEAPVPRGRVWMWTSLSRETEVCASVWSRRGGGKMDKAARTSHCPCRKRQERGTSVEGQVVPPTIQIHACDVLMRNMPD